MKDFLGNICDIVGHDNALTVTDGNACCARCGAPLYHFSLPSNTNIKNVKATQVGREIDITFEIQPTVPVKFATITFDLK